MNRDYGSLRWWWEDSETVPNDTSCSMFIGTSVCKMLQMSYYTTCSHFKRFSLLMTFIKLVKFALSGQSHCPTSAGSRLLMLLLTLYSSARIIIITAMFRSEIMIRKQLPHFAATCGRETSMVNTRFFISSCEVGNLIYCWFWLHCTVILPVMIIWVCSGANKWSG